VNAPEPAHVTRARALVDEATHATEHITRPDWCLDGAVPATQMTTERGNLRIGRESCRYCLADQAAALGLGAALEAYLNTPAPPTSRLSEVYLAEAGEDADADLVAEETAYRAGLAPAARAVYDVLERDVFAHHYYDDQAVHTLVHNLVDTVRLADAESNRGAEAVERAEVPPPLPDIPLFTIEGEAPA
jgi:hypothetical protein